MPQKSKTDHKGLWFEVKNFRFESDNISICNYGRFLLLNCPVFAFCGLAGKLGRAGLFGRGGA